jgi:hypothetical protein
VAVYENIRPLSRSAPEIPPYRLRTPRGTLTAGKIVYAVPMPILTAFRPLGRKQIPAFHLYDCHRAAHPGQLAPIGWEGFGRAGRCPQPDPLLPADSRPAHRNGWRSGRAETWGQPAMPITTRSAWAHLERHIHFLFPHLKGCPDQPPLGRPLQRHPNPHPCIGIPQRSSAVYSLGCIGHGVSMSHLNALTLRDLVLERKTT